MQFKSVDSQIDFPTLEGEILKFWEENGIFQKSIDNRKGQDRFVFYEGPPTANGKPHIGHVLQRSLKDLILRFQTMNGRLVERRAGWDTHGLPVEIEVEKELGLKGKQDILSLKKTEFESIEFFNQKCKESVFRYTDDWINLTKRIGFWIDFDDAYVTYHNDYIESVWWFLSEVDKNGLLYKDYKVVPYCPRCGTSLSSHELALGYRDDTEDPSVFIKFELEKELKTFLLVWTTTPWTLPGNVALAVGKNIDYVEVEQNNEKYILAKDRLNVLEGEYKILRELKADYLIGKLYKPLFDYLKPDKKAYFVTEAGFATEDEGTGIVHTAVMYGVQDFELGKKLDLPKKHLVSTKGEFLPEVTDFAGLFVKDADEKIIENLRQRNLLYKSGRVKHTYPFCWRCQTPILYYALDAWFIKTTSVKESLLEDNQKINWVPKSIKTGRMKNWLETLIDWNISRNRFWGTPLPVWQCQGGHFKVVSSRNELKDLGAEVPEDLHRPYIDQVKFNCPECKQVMGRVAEVADVWMDSGAMPFAQWHYPFENKETYQQWYPADYIVEGVDQTRGWFFTLMAEAMLLKNQSPSPFRNVISTGLVLDENGQKMSKSKGNVVDPWEVIGATGADTMRWYMFTSAPAGGNYLFSKDIVSEKHRKFTLILWNSYKFFVDYASLNNWQCEATPDDIKDKLTTLDQWILARLTEVVLKVNENLAKYNAMSASRTIEEFIVSDLSTWYIRRSRDRVGPSASKENEQIFLSTTYGVLVVLSKLLAPFTPFLAEMIYKNLTGDVSVHLQDFPLGDKSLLNPKLVSDMRVVRNLVETGHAQRKAAGIKLRQPLGKFTYESKERLSTKLEQIMADELNVKDIGYKKSSQLQPTGQIDTKINPELAAEGEARELIRQIQQLRRDQGLTLNDKIEVISQSVPKTRQLEQLVLKQTNATGLKSGSKLAIKVVK